MPEITRKNVEDHFKRKLNIVNFRGIIIHTVLGEEKIKIDSLSPEQFRGLNEIDPNDFTHGKPFDIEDGYLIINVHYYEVLGFNRNGDEIGY